MDTYSNILNIFGNLLFVLLQQGLNQIQSAFLCLYKCLIFGYISAKTNNSSISKDMTEIQFCNKYLNKQPRIESADLDEYTEYNRVHSLINLYVSFFFLPFSTIPNGKLLLVMHISTWICTVCAFLSPCN